MKRLEAGRFSSRTKGWRKASVPGVSLDRGSLTAALRRIALVTVQVLRQAHAQPDPHERRLLGRAAGKRVILREILLLCAGRPVVFARTAIPLGEQHGAWRALGSLGSRALGDFIFTDRLIERSGFVVKRHARHDPLVCRASRISASAIGPMIFAASGARRCLIRRRGRDIVLTEIFLADFPVVALHSGARKRASIIRP